MRYWFTSDQHFDHTKVIKYSKRPFVSPLGVPDVALMNETLIRRYNDVVAPDDCVYFLGDISMAGPDKTFDLVVRLNGTKHWVPGNHDKSIRRSAKIVALFEWVRDLAEIHVPDPVSGKAQRITLCHYPMKIWNKAHYGAWQLHGHSHGNLYDDPHALQADVGVDCWDYTPASFEQLKSKIMQKRFKPVDHHGRDEEE